MPCGSALLGGLAEQEAELLQALGEDVFARHGEMAAIGKGVRGFTREKCIIHDGVDSPSSNRVLL